MIAKDEAMEATTFEGSIEVEMQFVKSKSMRNLTENSL